MRPILTGWLLSLGVLLATPAEAASTHRAHHRHKVVHRSKSRPPPPWETALAQRQDPAAQALPSPGTAEPAQPLQD